MEIGANSKHIVIAGGGFGGAYAARWLERILPRDIRLTLIDRNNYLLFYPLLLEAGTGRLEPRHAVVPLRSFLRRTRFRMADVTGVDVERNEIAFRVDPEAPVEKLRYDHLVLALGSVTRFPPVPGLVDHGFEMKNLSDAVALRDHVAQMLERADNSADPAERKALLRFVIVGANFTGVEVAGEYQALVRDALARYPRLTMSDIEFCLVEYTDRLLPQLDAGLAERARRDLERRGVRLFFKTSVAAIEPHAATLSDGRRLATSTVIWCAGIAPHPLIAPAGLPANEKGYLSVERDLRVSGRGNVWALGDSATIPGPDGKPYPATAQFAVQEAEAVARNIHRALRGEPLSPCDARSRGAFCALGGRSAVAQVFAFKFSGIVAWFLFRTYYLLRMPGWGRKFRIALDWTLGAFSSTDVVRLSVHPRKARGRTAPPRPTSPAPV